MKSEMGGPAEGAFTLLEVMIVLILFSAVLVMSVPNFKRSYANFALRQTAHDIVYLMRCAQNRAVMEGAELRFNLDSALGRYWLTMKSSRPETVGKPLSGALARVNSIPPQVRFDPAAIHFDFYPDWRMEKGCFSICMDKKCLIVSTQEWTGDVDIMDEQ